jgi:hypothetical protein
LRWKKSEWAFSPEARRTIVDEHEFAADAIELAENGWVIHTIFFSEQADKSLMTNLAALGGGTHYHAPNGNALVQAFRDIALSLPGTLIN